jgi:hypothetical protein
VFDGIDSAVNRGLNADLSSGVGRDFDFDAMRLFDYRAHLVRIEDTVIVIDHDFDHIGAVRQRLSHGAARLFHIADGQELFRDDRGGVLGSEFDDLTADGRELSTGGLNARTWDQAFVDGVAQRGVAVDAGMPDVAHGGESGFEHIAGVGRADQRAFRLADASDRHDDGFAVRVPSAFHRAEQMAVRVNQSGQQRGLAEINDQGVLRGASFDRIERADIFYAVAGDEHALIGQINPGLNVEHASRFDQRCFSRSVLRER